MNYGERWSLASRNVLIFGIAEIRSCRSVKSVIRIIKNFAQSAKWHILLNNYTFLDVNHRIRTESGEAEFNFVSS